MSDESSILTTPATVAAEKETFIKTAAHNYVSRLALVEGPTRVELKGKCVLRKNVKVRGDLAWVRAGRYCSIDSDTVLEPPSLSYEPSKHIPLILKNHISISNHCRIFAAAIGSAVRIGEHCVLGQRCIIKDCCIIEPNSHIADDTVVPPFTRMAGKPAVCVEELPESVAVDLVDAAVQEYQQFVNGGPVL